jgi:light-regulated signal transduction histidine kinase (bacteriophytochrome)
MEQQNNVMGMLELILRPAFCVKDGSIVYANHQAQMQGVVPGAPISELLVTGKEEYTALNGSCLYLALCVQGHRFGASVTQADGLDIFVLEPEDVQPELQALALAARELREPLSNLMIAADRLLPTLDADDEATQRQAANINRSLHHMLRLISNMSDGARYAEDKVPRMEYQNVCTLVGDIFDKAASLVENAGITLRFTNHPETVRSLVDGEKLERAIYNLISNAVKFTPKGGHIEAKLTRHGDTMHLTVADNGRGIPQEQFSSVYLRYLRPARVEDSRYGIGLGMVMVQSAATAHGGTVLIEQPTDGGTKITLTLKIRPQTDGNFRSPRLKVDYAGERDHGLIELSDLLPASIFNSKKIN